MDATTKPTTAQQQIPLNSGIYFCPNPVTDEKFSKHYWVGSAIDQYRFFSGLIYRSEAGAIAACNIMLAALAPADTMPRASLVVEFTGVEQFVLRAELNRGDDEESKIVNKVVKVLLMKAHDEISEHALVHTGGLQ